MLRWAEIKQIYDELHSFVLDGQIQKVRQPDPLTLVLSIRSPGHTTHLVLSAHPGVVRVAASPSTTSTLASPTALGSWVRASGGGRRVSGFSLSPTDRIIQLELAEGLLVAELTGSTANLYGIHSDGRLVTSARPIPKSRGLEINGVYTEPRSGLTERSAESRYLDAVSVESKAQGILAEQTGTLADAARSRLLKKAAQKLARLEKNILEDERRCAGAELLKRRGELLKGQLYRYARGSSSVDVQDWYAEGLPMVNLQVDPKLDGPGNVERLFKQYRRARDGIARVADRRKVLDELRHAFQNLAENPTDVGVLEKELRRLGLVRQQSTLSQRTQSVSRLPFRRFVSRHGEAILVGRGGADNHDTTFKHSRGNDFWLHVRDVPGAHVIVPRPSRDHEPHYETLVDAAALAVHYSKLRGEAGVDVTITQRKNVRAIKGGPPGRVTIAAAKTMTCDRDEERILRLFGDAEHK